MVLLDAKEVVVEVTDVVVESDELLLLGAKADEVDEIDVVVGEG